MLYLTELDLNQNELQNAVVQNLASPPISPLPGQVYYNSNLNKFGYWDGTVWVYSATVVSSDAGNDITAGTDDGAYFQEAVTTLSYNGATGDLTYTDEDGLATVINLPVEWFLNAATFNPTTSVLTLTLNNGTDVDVDLSALVETYALTVTDTGTVDMTLAGTGTPGDPWDVSANVNISTDADNELTLGGDGGLYVPSTHGHSHSETVTLSSVIGWVTITHGLGTTDVIVQTFRVDNGRTVVPRTERLNATQIRVLANGPSRDYTVVVTS